MKRLMTVLLAVALVLCASVPAFAAPAKISALDILDDATTHDETIALTGTTLTPGEEYDFPIQFTIGASTMTATPTNSADYKFTANFTTGSSAMTSAKIEENDAGNLVLRLTCKSSYSTKMTSVTVALKAIYKNTSASALSITAPTYSFKVGWKTIADADLPQSAGDYVSVLPETPVFTKSQLNKIAKLNNYKNVTFASDDWEFTTNITDMDGVNMIYNSASIKEVATKFQDQELRFLNFPAATQFEMSGKMKIFVSDYYDDFNGNFFVYRYVNGKLAKINAVYDSNDESLNFNTNTLGRFVITDQAITDVNVLTVLPNGTSANPNTGANDMVNVAATLAVVSLCTAGAIVFRRKMK